MAIWRVDVLITVSNWIPSLEPSSRGPNKGDCAIEYEIVRSLESVSSKDKSASREARQFDVDNTSFKNTIDLHYHLLYILLRKSALS